jgi:hypothetical protein
MLAVLRMVTEKSPAARDVRRRLAVELLPWMRSQSHYTDIYGNRDILQDSLRFDAEMLSFQARSGRLKALSLYEAALSMGMLDEAKGFSDQAQAVSPAVDTISELIEIAERAKIPSEVERLKELKASVSNRGSQ